MGKNVFIDSLTEGQRVSDLFLVSRKNLAETKNGKPYLALALMDKTGEIEARAWDNAARFDTLAEVGAVVVIQGQVTSYRDQLQLNISSLDRAAPDSIPLEAFMPASRRSTHEMQTELADLIGTLSDDNLKTLLEKIFRGETLKRFSTAPAAKKMHHAYLGGLLEHTLSVAGLAARLCDHYPELDHDLLLAGALLHDIGKMEEFSFASVPFDYTDSGRLIGHLVLGCDLVRNHAADIPGFPARLLDRLVHLILSHHGRHEFGAPCLPMTLEALLLHHLDDMDAKVNYIDRLSEQIEPGTYQWSDYQRPLERFLLLRGRPEGTRAPQQNSEKRETPAPEEEQKGPEPLPGQQTLF